MRQIESPHWTTPRAPPQTTPRTIHGLRSPRTTTSTTPRTPGPRPSQDYAQNFQDHRHDPRGQAPQVHTQTIHGQPSRWAHQSWLCRTNLACFLIVSMACHSQDTCNRDAKLSHIKALSHGWSLILCCEAARRYIRARGGSQPYGCGCGERYDHLRL